MSRKLLYLPVAVRPVREKKRVLNRMVGGVVTFAAAPPPIDFYAGATDRRKIDGPQPNNEPKLTPKQHGYTSVEDKSLG